MYTVYRNITHSEEFSGNQEKHQNFDPSILPYKFGLIFMGMKQRKKKILKSPILKIFSRKFFRFILGLVGLNDAKGIDVAQLIWPWGCRTRAQKQPKSTENAFFGCFWAFVGQPHGHLHWATSMPFVSFNPTNPRTNLRNFHEKIMRICDFNKWAFFESAILNFFLLHSHENQTKFIW